MNPRKLWYEAVEAIEVVAADRVVAAVALDPTLPRRAAGAEVGDDALDVVSFVRPARHDRRPRREDATREHGLEGHGPLLLRPRGLAPHPSPGGS